jgi:hypothetical protein
LAVFPRCSLGPHGSRYGRFARALKNSQLTCGDITIICETVHLGLFSAEATGHQVSNQDIAIYLVKDGKIVSGQWTADERQEFHDLAQLDLNHSPAFTVEA